MAAFFFAVLLAVGVVTLKSSSAEKRVFGGPVESPAKGASVLNQLALLASRPAVGPAGAPSDLPIKAYEPALAIAALADRGRPIGLFPLRPGLIVYTVKKGDTLSRIAVNFGITVQTVSNANPSVRERALQIGQELKILPASGVLYETREGDTLESIADLFSIQPVQIQDYNHSVNFGALEQGVSLLIPGGRAVPAARRSSLPNLAGYFAEPAQGYNWGQLHPHNAVDIANTCGTNVSAAAEGLVIPDDLYGDGTEGWNGGYGVFILIEHPNGTKTRYAHLEKAEVSIGDYVKQGEEIGTMGNTGNTHGPTGCHLHFEVYGAENPFAKEQ